MKLCIHCKHFRSNPTSPGVAANGLCALFEGAKSPVDGSWVGQEYQYCSVARQTPCGTSGRFYEDAVQSIQNTNPENVVILPNGLGVAYE